MKRKTMNQKEYNEMLGRARKYTYDDLISNPKEILRISNESQVDFDRIHEETLDIIKKYKKQMKW